MALTGEALIRVQAEVSNALAGLKSLQGELTKTVSGTGQLTANTKGTGQAIDKFRGSVGSVVQQMTGFNIAALAGAGGVALLGKEIISRTRETQAYDQAVYKMSLALKVSTEETSRAIQVADDYGISQESLTTSLRFALNQGITPNIAGLAGLSDKYLALEGTEERAAFAQKNLGKNWMEYVRLLEAGGDAIRKQSEGIAAGLIVTKEQAAASERLRIAQDDLNDAWTAGWTVFGNKLIPVLATGVRILANMGPVTEDLNLKFGQFWRTGEAIGALKDMGLNQIARAAGFAAEETGFLKNALTALTSTQWTAKFDYQGQAAESGAMRLLAYLREISDRRWGVNVGGTYVGPWQPGGGAGAIPPAGMGAGTLTLAPWASEADRTYAAAHPDLYGGQHGLDMIFPPGYPNDTGRVAVSSGEHVKVTPAREKSKRDAPVIGAININSSPLDQQYLVRMIKSVVGM